MSSSSGVQVDPACIEAFQSLKLGKKFKYVIYKLSADNTSIVVEKQAESGSYDDFVAELPSADCRWAVYDFDFKTKDGDRNKIIFYAWSPDDAKIKSKMLYSSSKDALRRSLNGIAAEIQGTDLDEVAYETVFDKINRV
ncbi:cofilin [Haplosporangium sp. Z 767]|nr:cofilin [Haplosporangium sp. Z 767]KAF9179188.1 cofilin [Haplosporangium sp. Z 11]